MKKQINEKGLEQLRKKSDEICSRFGLEVLKPYQKPKQRTMNQREYRVALRGDSKKLRLMNAIDYAVINRYRAERDDLGAIFNGATVEEPDEGDSGENLFGDSIAQRGTHDYSENENQVVHSWSDIADGSVNLAADLAMIIDDEVEDDWQRKQVVERKKRPKSRPKSGFKMKM